MARVFRGRYAATPVKKDLPERAAPRLKPVLNAGALNVQYGCMPMQPDGSTRVSEVSSSARLPARGGAFSADVAQKCASGASKPGLTERGEAESAGGYGGLFLAKGNMRRVFQLHT